MTQRIVATLAILALATTLFAQDKKAKAGSNLTGTWNMGVQSDHVVPIALVLEQDGTAVTGTIAMPTQHAGQHDAEVTLTGDFVNGALKLSGTVKGASESTTLEVTATLNDEGTLEGKISMPRGSHPFTAERLRERK